MFLSHILTFCLGPAQSSAVTLWVPIPASGQAAWMEVCLHPLPEATRGFGQGKGQERMLPL